MTDKGTIKIPREDFERHNQRRKELGLTWLEYIDGEAPEDHFREDTARQVVSVLRDELGVEGDADLPSIIRKELGSDGDADTDAIESSLEVIEARTGRIEQTLEGMQGR